MKRSIVFWLRTLLIIYIAWTCYTRGKHIPDHMEKVANGIESVSKTAERSFARMGR